MFAIKSCQIPDSAFLEKYREAGAYTDCFFVDIQARVSHAQYVTAFYTTWVFKLERLILKWAISRPSTDAQAKLLAKGSLDTFAAWHVERRAENQLLLSDINNRTRSWLMSMSPGIEGGTRLYFGSAIVLVKNTRGEPTLGLVFKALLGFHKIYSKVLLHSAKSRLKTQLS